MKKLNYLCLLCLLVPAMALADKGAVVKCVQPDGSVVYTNQKCASGKTEKINRHPDNSPLAAVSPEFAFAAQQSKVDVIGEGTVIKILPDDKAGGRHQRFIIRMASSQSLLIAHNIDLAPRIDNLKTGDVIKFYGEYLWNEKGGLLHWTHRDPQGLHKPGWLMHDGKKYQ